MKNKSRLFSLIAIALLIPELVLNFYHIFTSNYYGFSGTWGFGKIWAIYGFVYGAVIFSLLYIVCFLFNNKIIATIPFVLNLVFTFTWFSLTLDWILSFALPLTVILLFILSTVLPWKKVRKVLNFTWFIPALLYGVDTVIYLINYGGIPGRFIPGRVLYLCFYLAIGLWAKCIPEADSDELSDSRTCENSSYVKQNEDGYVDLLTHILLLLFTFGIWQYVWIYKTTAYLNNTPGEEKRNPTTKLLLCMFIPFYYIYWTYKSAQRIDKLAHSRGQASDISAMCLILSILVGIVPPIIMQEKMNDIARPKNNVSAAANTYTAQATAPTPSAIGAADEIKKYKELLDIGAITQEEFEEKKKQLLNL